MSGVSGNGAVRKPSFIEILLAMWRDDLAFDGDPLAAGRALRERLGDRERVESVAEGGIGGFRRRAAAGDVRVDLREQRAERVGVALDVAAGVADDPARLGGDQR